MKFCNQCGGALSRRVPDGDSLVRHVCDACSAIHYQNPLVVVGHLPYHGDRVLMCLRGIEPRRNKWTLPAGFLENDETTLEGARRETLEEACATVRHETFYRLFDVPHINQVHVFYRGELCDGPEREMFAPGAETLEVRLFEERDIPWGEIAFPTVAQLLRDWWADRQRGAFPVRVSALDRTGRPRAS